MYSVLNSAAAKPSGRASSKDPHERSERPDYSTRFKRSTRPRGGITVAAVRQTAHVRSIEVHGVDVEIAGPIRGEREMTAVGRPARPFIDVAIVREAPDRAALGVLLVSLDVADEDVEAA